MERIKKIFFEMIPVILGVLIALAVDNVKTNFDNKEKLHEVIDLVGREAKENIKVLDLAIKTQGPALDTILKYLDDEKLTLFEVLKRGGGIQLPQIKSYTPSLLYNLQSEDKVNNWPLISIISENTETVEYLKQQSFKLRDIEYISKNASGKLKLSTELNDVLQTEKLVMRTFLKIDSLVSIQNKK